MRKELPYFRVEGAVGGSQDWFTQDRWMKRGGCAAITATDCSLYFSLYKGRKAACPQAQPELTKKEYISLNPDAGYAPIYFVRENFGMRHVLSDLFLVQ